MSKEQDGAHVIVIGNEKGGAGKTTTSIHLIIFLLKIGFRVASFDADIRQKSLTRYIENREKYCQAHSLNLKMPKHKVLEESTAANNATKEMEEKENFLAAFNPVLLENDFIIIDTPGSNTYISRLAHSYADTIVTPINDSFLDLDVLGQVNPDNFNIIKPSFYSELIWKQKIERAKREKSEINWVVLRNRLSNLDATNKRNVGEALSILSNKVGFRIAEGFKERVIFRELFLHGLTLLDLGSDISDIKMTLSHVAAKEELKNFLKELNIEKINKVI